MSEEQKLLTVKDIAEAISFSKSEEGITRTIRQIRHWTQSDLLRPISQKSTGKGVPRVYEEEPTVLIAAILLELSRYGVTVDILKFASMELYEDCDEYFGGSGWYVSTALTDMNVFLQIAWTSDPITGAFVGANVAMYDDRELSQEGYAEDSQPEQVILREPSSSILVNLTQVAERIYPFPWH